MDRDYELHQDFRQACALGDVELIDSLIDKVDINAACKMNGFTALHWAYKRKQRKVIEMLITKGAVEVKDLNGRMPSELGGIEFEANYIKNPVKAYDLQGVEIELKKGDSSASAPMAGEAMTREAVVPEKESRPTARQSYNTKPTMDTKVRSTEKPRCFIIYCLSTKQALGQVFCHGDPTIQELLDLVRNELGLSLDIIKRRYLNMDIPIAKRQYGHKCSIHFGAEHVIMVYCQSFSSIDESD